MSRWAAIDGIYPLLEGSCAPGLLRRLRTLADEEGDRLTVTVEGAGVRVTHADGRPLTDTEDAHVRATLASNAVTPW